MNFVCVDLGASNTRFVSDSGKISMINNNMVFLAPGTVVDMEPYAGGIENALEIEISKEGDSEFFPVKALIGQMAERYSSNNDRPSGAVSKYKQRINYVSAVVAVALSKIAHGLSDEMEVYLALPPAEVRFGKEEVKNNLCGKYTVQFVKFEDCKTVTFNIVNTSCFEESFMALLSYYFSMNGVPNEAAKKYTVGNVLSLDIGASTTDLAIVKDGRYLDKSGQTYKIGGNLARDYLIDSIRAEYGYELPVNDAELTMAEGMLQSGSGYVNVSHLVEEAKKHFAKSIADKMQYYFGKIEIPIQVIRAIVVSGGGSMQSQYINEDGETIKTSEPMSYYITEAVRDICENVVVESYGESPRIANISGLFIRAKADMANKARKAMQQVQGTVIAGDTENSVNG